MTSSRSLIRVSSLIAILAMLLTACGGTGGTGTTSNTPAANTTPTTGTTSNAAPQKGGTVIDGISQEPDSLLPNFTGETFGVLVQRAIWEPLFYSDDKGKVHEALAAEVPSVDNSGISKDGLTYTFKLKPGLKWSDGQPLTAKDVDFSWKYWMQKDAPVNSTLGFDKIKSTDIKDDQTIVFHMISPFSPFVAQWIDTPAVMPEHVFKSIAAKDVLKSPENLKPSVVNGAFTVSEFKTADHITVNRNPNYYLPDHPYLDSIIFKIIANADTEVSDLKAGSIQTAWFLPVTLLDQMKSIPNTTFHAVSGQNFEAIWLNEHNPIFQDVKVRQALVYGLDRQKLIDAVWKGQAKIIATDQTTADASAVFNPDVKPYPYDPEKAKQLLDEAGWKAGPDGIRVKNGQRLSFKYSTTAGRAYRLQDEQIAQANWKQIGVEAIIQNFPAKTLFGTILKEGKPAAQGGFDAAEFETGNNVDPDDTAFWNSKYTQPNGSNYTFYNNPEMDKLTLQQAAEPDFNKRKELLFKIQEIVNRDVPVIFQYAPADLSVNSNKVHNYSPAPTSNANETWNIWDWWLEK